MAIKVHSSFALHPGPWVKRNVIAPYGMTVTGAAAHLNVARPPFSKVLNGNAALSPELAIRLEKAFGISARTLLNMQAAHSLAMAQAKADGIKVERLPEPV